MEENQSGSYRNLIARQPILDGKKNIYGYELLFRSSLENLFQSNQPDAATSNVMVSGFITTGIESLTGGRRAFVNFTRNLIMQEYATLLPKEQVVIEILEQVVPDEPLIEACRALKRKGYMLALDDYVYEGPRCVLLDLADIVKVDWLATPPDRRVQLARELGPRRVKLLAEKVETHDQFSEAASMGYTYFQGFFFCKPEIVSRRDIPASKLNYLCLLREVHKEDCDISEIERIVKREPSLCYKLLRYLNSAAFSFRGNITSVRHALTLIGLKEIRKIVSLVALASMGAEKPAALVVTSIIRGKFCEAMGMVKVHRQEGTELFLMGLFSLMDAILDRPMDEIMSELPLSNEVKNCLLGRASCYSSFRELAASYERSDWGKVAELATSLGLSDDILANSYIEAVKWSHEISRLEKERVPS